MLTTPNDALIGIPTTVNPFLIIEIPLITPTELNIVAKFVISTFIFLLFFIIFVLKIHNVLMIFPNIKHIKNMDSWELVDIDPTNRDELERKMKSGKMI